MVERTSKTRGFTITEMIIVIAVFAIVMVGVMTALLTYLRIAATATIRANAYGLAVQEIEWLRSMPYDNLAVAGGGIITSATPLPSTKTIVITGYEYEVRYRIYYGDDAYDGCLPYPPNLSYLCRNGPPETGKPADTNPKDYKLAQVDVYDKKSNTKYASLNSIFTARVAETGGNTSAIIVTIVDSAGNPVNGASVRVQNSALSPAVDQTQLTDDNGVALFLDIAPDSSPRFVVSASKNGYSSLSTIATSGALVPTYPNVSALVQQVSSATLRIDPISNNSLLAMIVDGAGNPRPGASFDIRGGYKLYTDPADMSYSYNQTVTANSSGEVSLGGLTPGEYLICQASMQACSGGQYLGAVWVAVGAAPYQPFTIPSGNIPAANGYMQTIQLHTVTLSSLPRISSVEPSAVSLASPDIASTDIIIKGANISGAVVTLEKPGVTITSTTVGSDTPGQIARQFDLSAAATGGYTLKISAGGTIEQNSIAPGAQGGVNVTP